LDLLSVTNEEGYTACSACGTVIKCEEVLVGPDHGGSYVTPVPAAKRKVTVLDVQRERDLRQALHQHLPRNLHAAAFNLYRQYRNATTKRIYHQTAISAVVYVIACANQVPIRAQSLVTPEADKKSIIRATMDITAVCGLEENPRLKPLTMMRWIVDTLGIQAPLRYKLVDMGIELYRIAETCWLKEGRKSGCLEAASIVIAARTLKTSTKCNAETIATRLRMNALTIKGRVDEMLNIFVSVAQKLPWRDLINKASVHLYLPFILEFSAPLFKRDPMDMIMDEGPRKAVEDGTVSSDADVDVGAEDEEKARESKKRASRERSVSGSRKKKYVAP